MAIEPFSRLVPWWLRVDRRQDDEEPLYARCFAGFIPIEKRSRGNSLRVSTEPTAAAQPAEPNSPAQSLNYEIPAQSIPE